MDQKPVVHLHDGILCSRKGGSSYPFQHHGGSGEHYAKWNKPGGKKQIPYDLTINRNLINKMNKQAKYNQRH